MKYHWEIQPSEETDPHFVFTDTDSVVDAAKQFEETWGEISVMYIRKIAVTKQLEYGEDFRKSLNEK
ncbi:hypothetical protein [Sporosarcina jiandibaonis]|uniref:hypothetical protein n=1 Tax=Sporosarcina jiandibaonis TaxID=2715535 RepID=UPI001552379E|nr:hypothetical protein [Sporosarcina jiandibaonis]